MELIQRVPGGRGGQQGRARYGRGGSRCAGGEASIPGQSTSTRTGRNVSTCARRGESEISAVAGSGGEGGRATRQAEEAGSRKVEAGSRNQAGWTGDATGMKVNPGDDGLRKAGARGSFHWRKRMMGGAWHGVVIRIWGGGSRCASCNSGTPSDVGMSAARRVGTNEGEMSKAR